MGIVVITGTSSGIGLATAVTLARAGHTVFAGMRNLDRGDDLREAISKESLSIKIVQLDVDDDNYVDGAFKQILKETSRIDVLVNNAGVSGTAASSISLPLPVSSGWRHWGHMLHRNGLWKA